MEITRKDCGIMLLGLLATVLLAVLATGCVGTPIKLSKANGLEAPDKLWGEQSAMFYQRTGDSVTLMAYGLTKDSATAIILGLGGTALGGATAGAPGALVGGAGGGLIGAWADSNTSRTQNTANQALKAIPSIDPQPPAMPVTAE